MRVERLSAETFRNYEQAEVAFAPTLNLIVGRNAQGKTSLLEAVHCLSGLGSPRSPDSELIQAGSDAAFLHADIARQGRTVHVDMELRRGRAQRALINGAPTRGAKALRELVVAVFFGPDDLSIVKGAPDGRRRFIDDLVVKLRPAREVVRKEWERVLRQRNTLLKSSGDGPTRPSRDTLSVWDDALARAGAQLALARLEALGALVPYAGKRYGSIAGRGQLQLRYTSSWLDDRLCGETMVAPGSVSVEALQQALREKIEEVRPREFERKISLAGPHRDDIAMQLPAGESGAAPLDARAYGSQGDQRTTALALKLGELDLLTDVLGEEPVLLLDDVFSELDRDRRSWLADVLRSGGQTLLSSAEPLEDPLMRPARVIEVAAGKARIRD